MQFLPLKTNPELHVVQVPLLVQTAQLAAAHTHTDPL